MSENQAVINCGGWSDFNYQPSAEEKHIFKQALEGLCGVSYTFTAVASQVVAGMNYCYLAEGTIVTPGSPRFPALIYVYKPLNDSPHITEIQRIRP